MGLRVVCIRIPTAKPRLGVVAGSKERLAQIFQTLCLGQREVAGAVDRFAQPAIGLLVGTGRQLAGRGCGHHEATHQVWPIHRQHARRLAAPGMPHHDNGPRLFLIEHGGNVGCKRMHVEIRHRALALANAARLRPQDTQPIGCKQAGHLVVIFRAAPKRRQDDNSRPTALAERFDLHVATAHERSLYVCSVVWRRGARRHHQGQCGAQKALLQRHGVSFSGIWPGCFLLRAAVAPRGRKPTAMQRTTATNQAISIWWGSGRAPSGPAWRRLPENADT